MITDQYPALVERTVAHGIPASPRGKACKKFTSLLLDWDAFPNVPKGIGFNKKFAIAELMAIVAGHNSVHWLAQFNPKIVDFSDDGETFHGHYGERLETQWEAGIQKLRDDKDTRQAVFQIWDWALDGNNMVSRDFPCNVVFQIHRGFQGRYDMSVFQRSSDLIWGLPYDHFVFGCILDLICTELGVETGKVNRYISDAHVYDPGVYYPKERIDAAIACKEWGLWSPNTSFSHFFRTSVEVIEFSRDGKPLTTSPGRALAKELGLCE